MSDEKLKIFDIIWEKVTTALAVGILSLPAEVQKAAEETVYASVYAVLLQKAATIAREHIGMDVEDFVQAARRAFSDPKGEGDQALTQRRN